MVLCVAGNVEINKVLDLCDKILKPSKPLQLEKIFEEEPVEIVKSRVEQKLSVAAPIFQLGFKEPVTKTRLTVQQIAETEILLELLASDASPLFRRLLDAELINESSFSYEYFEGPGYASVIFAGESKDPDAVADEIKKEIVKMRENGLDSVAFERSRKAVYGRIISSFNSVDYLANAMASDAFADREIFNYIESVASAEIHSVEKRFETQLKPEYSALSVVKPID